MKIGILTYFWSDNPGTFLQAYSMLRTFEVAFPDSRVELINYRLRRTLFRPAKRAMVSITRLMEHWRRFRAYSQLQRTHLNLGRHRCISGDYEEAWSFIEQQGYDLIVVGSDTILKLVPTKGEKGMLPIYWLPRSMKCRKVMCAASSAGLSIDNLDASLKERMRDSIRGFDLVGVRDCATYSLMMQLGIEDATVLDQTPDPTFAYTIDPGFAQDYVNRKVLDVSRPIIGVNLPKRFLGRKQIYDYFHSRGYAVVSLCPSRWADVCLIDINPFEWAGIYKCFALVITDRFHGTIFALKNGVPVMSVRCRENIVVNGDCKLHSLLKALGLIDLCFYDGIRGGLMETFFDRATALIDGFKSQAVAAKVEMMHHSFIGFVEEVKRL